MVALPSGLPGGDGASGVVGSEASQTLSWERMFGGPLDITTAADILCHNWNFTECDEATIIAIIRDLTDRLANRNFSVVGENIGRWQKGWSENLHDYRKTGDVHALTPKYLKASRYLRLGSQFIVPADPNFEANWYQVFRGWFARHHLSGFDAIYEFGAGSGHNVAWLAQAFPEKQIVGLDWADASFEIMLELAKKFPNVSGGRFDFFSPSHFEFPKNSAVLTVGALEQTGQAWWQFYKFLCRQKPAMCFHIEPIVEWYDPDTSLIDATAIAIHRARGFQQGFVNEITPKWKHRTGFGSLLLEGYSQLAWDPRASEQCRIDSLEGAP